MLQLGPTQEVKGTASKNKRDQKHVNHEICIQFGAEWWFIKVLKVQRWVENQKVSNFLPQNRCEL